MTINAYQTLYESAIAWGMRKALESEQGKADMEKKASITQRQWKYDRISSIPIPFAYSTFFLFAFQIDTLEEDKKELERQVQELKSKCEFIEKRENERRAHEEKKHMEEVSFLKRTNQQLKTQLESILKKN
jgi:dynein light intermediate chain